MRVLRLVAVLVGVLAIVAACVACRMWWHGEVDGQVQAFVDRAAASADTGEVDTDDGKQSSSHGRSSHPQRILTTDFELGQDGPDLKVGESIRLRLTADDPLLTEIRRGNGQLGGSFASAAFVECGSAGETYPPVPSFAGQVSQPYKGADGMITFHVSELPLPESCSRGLRIGFDARGITRPVDGITTWNVHVQGRGLWITGLTGATGIRQTPTQADFQVKPKSTASVSLSATDPAESGRLSGRDELVSAFQHPLHGNAYGLAAGALSLALATGMGVLPLARAHAPLPTRRRWTVAVATGIAVTGGVYAAVLWTPVDGAATGVQYVPLVAWAWFVLPFLLLVTAVRALEGRPPGPRRLGPALVPSLVACAGPAAYAVGFGRPLTALVVVGLGALLTAGVYVLAAKGSLGVTARRWRASLAGTAWLLHLGIVLPPGLSMPYEASPFEAWHTLATAEALFVLWLWSLALWQGIRLLVPGLPRAVVVLLPSVLFWILGAAWPAVLLEDDYSSGFWVVFQEGYAETAPAMIITLVAFWGSVVHLFRSGGVPGTWPDHLRTLAIGLAAAAGATHGVVGGVGTLDRSDHWIDYAAVGAAVLGTAWLLPPGRAQTAARLHAASERQHAQAVERLLREQTLNESRRQFLIASRAELAEGKIDPAGWDQRWRLLSPGSGRPPGARHLLSLRRLALGTCAGRPAWRNALAAAAVVVVVALPISAYRAVPLLDTVHPLALLNGWTWVVRWIAYGVIYGYAYPWLRGATPVGKAMCLFVTILPVEVLPLLYQDAAPGDFGIALLQLVGNSLAACLILGLYWEARLVRAAGLRWGQVRNFRSLSALAVPTTTVLVAVLTAVATTVAGTLLAPTQEQAPSPQPSGSPTASQR